jgi:hypothetical protein
VRSDDLPSSWSYRGNVPPCAYEETNNADGSPVYTYGDGSTSTELVGTEKSETSNEECTSDCTSSSSEESSNATISESDNVDVDDGNSTATGSDSDVSSQAIGSNEAETLDDLSVEGSAETRYR